jgi:hypothetical protein
MKASCKNLLGLSRKTKTLIVKWQLAAVRLPLTPLPSVASFLGSFCVASARTDASYPMQDATSL